MLPSPQRKRAANAALSLTVAELLSFLSALFTVGSFHGRVEGRKHLLGFIGMWAARLQLNVLLVSLGSSVRGDNFAAGIGGCHSDQILALPEIRIGTIRIRGYRLIEGFNRLLPDLDVISGV